MRTQSTIVTVSMLILSSLFVTAGLADDGIALYTYKPYTYTNPQTNVVYNRAVFVYWACKDDENFPNDPGYKLNRAVLRALHRELHEGNCNINELGNCQFEETPSIEVLRQSGSMDVFLGCVGGKQNLMYLFGQDVIIKVQWIPTNKSKGIPAEDAVHFVGPLDEVTIRAELAKYLESQTAPPVRKVVRGSPKTTKIVTVTPPQTVASPSNRASAAGSATPSKGK